MMYVLCYRVSEPARFGTVPAPATVTNIKRIRQAKACLLSKYKFLGPSLFGLAPAQAALFNSG